MKIAKTIAALLLLVLLIAFCATLGNKPGQTQLPVMTGLVDQGAFRLYINEEPVLVTTFDWKADGSYESGSTKTLVDQSLYYSLAIRVNSAGQWISIQRENPQGLLTILRDVNSAYIDDSGKTSNMQLKPGIIPYLSYNPALMSLAVRAYDQTKAGKQTLYILSAIAGKIELLESKIKRLNQVEWKVNSRSLKLVRYLYSESGGESFIYVDEKGRVILWEIPFEDKIYVNKIYVRKGYEELLNFQISNPQATLSTVEERIVQIESGRYTSDGLSITKRMLARKIPGLSIAVINNGEIEWARGYGVIEAGSKQLVNTSTIFQAASISKPITALAAVRMVQDGMLALDEDVNQKLVNWKVPENEFTVKEKVTLRRLLSHSAGTTVGGFRGYSAGEPVPNLLQVLQGRPPAYSDPVIVNVIPGTQDRYSGGGISIVQQLIVDVTGISFPDFMRKTVLQPLGMNDSTFEQPLPPDRSVNAATGHQRDGEAIFGKWRTYPQMAAAGLWTTPSDLARVIIEIQRSLHGESNRLLSASMTKEMLRIQSVGKGNYGLGFSLVGEGENARFWHGGANAGFSSIFVGFNELGQGAVIMTNGDWHSDTIAMEILRSIWFVYKWPYP